MQSHFNEKYSNEKFDQWALYIEMLFENQQTPEVPIQTMISFLHSLDLNKISKMHRIYMIDSAIKAGRSVLVEEFGNQFIKYKLEDDIKKPSELSEMGLHPYRPTFWLPSITTGNPLAPKSEYEKMEKYFYEKFQIPEKVEIQGKLVTRDEYLKGTEQWKHLENIRLFTQKHAVKTRYIREIFKKEISEAYSKLIKTK